MGAVKLDSYIIGRKQRIIGMFVDVDGGGELRIKIKTRGKNQWLLTV